MWFLLGCLIVLPILLLAWQRIRPAPGQSRAWIANAEAIGLRYKQTTMPIVNVVLESVAGEMGGVHVEVTASEEHGERSICVAAILDPPLRAGLHASTIRGAREMPGETRPLRDLAKIPGWSYRAHDAPLAEALLGRLAKTLRHFPHDGRDLTIVDEQVAIRMACEGTRDEIEGLLEETLEVHANVITARKRVGPADWEKAAASSWAEVAAREGLALQPGALKLQGRTDRFEIEVAVQIDFGGARQTRITLTLPEPVPGRASLARAGSKMTAFLPILGEVDAPTGDTAFDARFVVHAPSVEAAREALGDAVRGALLDLPAEIWGGSIGGATVSLHADDVLPGPALAALLRSADRLAIALLPAAPRGGYRERA